MATYPHSLSSFKNTNRYVYACLVFLILSINSKAKDFSESEIKLLAGFGYMITDIDLTAKPVILMVKRMNTTENPIEIDITNTPDHWFLKKIHKGNYQILNIKIPFFDLPYIIDTHNDPRWKFTIEEKTLNYIGRIEVSKERTTTYAKVRLLNRFVTDFEEIQSEFKSVINSYNIKNGIDARDDFSEILIEYQTNKR